MNVVALRPPKAEAGTFSAIDGRIARVEMYDSMAAAEPHWRALELTGGLATPYQGFDLLDVWQRHVGVEAGVTPLIVVAFNAADAPLFVLPFGSRIIFGCRVVEFLGGKHANFNMPLWRRDAAALITAADLRAVLERLAGRADLVRLINQPLSWAGATNPFALLPHQHAANFGHSGALVADFEALLRARTNSSDRKKMRKKEHVLASFGAVRFEQARGPQEVRHVLDAFFKQKGARMRALGLPDVFASPGVRRFIEAASAGDSIDGAAPVELYALMVDDIIVATMGGIAGGGRFCAMFNSIAAGRYAQTSPGEQLIVRLVRQCCARGFNAFDLGIGEAQYKNLFCGDAEPLFDSYLPLSATGRWLAAAFALTATAKRTVKQRPELWLLVRAFRAMRARFAAEPR